MKNKNAGPHPAPHSLNRRDFIKRSIAVSALGFPTIIGSRVLARNGQAGANDRINIGIIGAGVMGTGHVQNFSGQSNATVAAIADVYLPRAEERVKWLHDNDRVGEGKKVDVYQDYRHILERKDIDAVVVVTPEHWHALQAIHAAQAGKHIYCEKNLALTIWEGRQIVKAVNKYKVVLQTGTQQRSGMISNVGITHLRNGTLGKITRVLASNYGSPMESGWPGMPVPEGLDWDKWCGPAEKLPYNHAIRKNGRDTEPTWSSIRNFGGSIMTDWGGHGLDMIQWGLGMDDRGPEEVWVEGEPFVTTISTPEQPGGRRTGVTTPKVYMKYDNGVIVEFEGGPQFGGIFIGENGSLNLNRGRAQSNPVELTQRPLENPAVEIYRGQEYARRVSHAENWLECIKTGATPAAPVETGHRSATVCHLANIARWVSGVTQETGNKLRWDSVNERFTNSEVGNSFLRRPQRPGYQVPEEV